MKTRFKELSTGDQFDFVSPDITFNSFFDPCEKISVRKYRSLSTGQEYQVGSIAAKVYNVKEKVLRHYVAESPSGERFFEKRISIEPLLYCAVSPFENEDGEKEIAWCKDRVAAEQFATRKGTVLDARIVDGKTWFDMPLSA
jgi:hypothetical protein